ncbi:hypothetical protein UFO1_3263 [Pelosinus sp. UFO1]|nr:hypothetical protein UFO1_3263 [Pelosinus sp. UFO1]
MVHVVITSIFSGCTVNITIDARPCLLGGKVYFVYKNRGGLYHVY